MPFELVVAAKQRRGRFVLMKQHVPQVFLVDGPKLVDAIPQQRHMAWPVPTDRAHRTMATPIFEQDLRQDPAGAAAARQAEPQIPVFIALLGHPSVVSS